jgi:esterase
MDFRTILVVMKLFFRESGQGEPLLILHGLFGSSDNWHTVAKTFAQSYHVFVIDQRNHGQSPHSDDFNYSLLTEDLNDFIEDHRLTRPIIIGHSMGGKTAMNFAVRYPGKVQKLVVVDIVPKIYPLHHDRIVEGLKSIDLNTLTSRKEADSLLTPYVPTEEEKQFLLKNLLRTPGGFKWRINLSAIDKHLIEMGEGMQFPGSFEGPSLFIHGRKSFYYQDGDDALIKKIFPQARFVVLETGHWVQAEDPEAFLQTTIAFLKEG